MVPDLHYYGELVGLEADLPRVYRDHVPDALGQFFGEVHEGFRHIYPGEPVVKERGPVFIQDVPFLGERIEGRVPFPHGRDLPAVGPSPYGALAAA